MLAPVLEWLSAPGLAVRLTLTTCGLVIFAVGISMNVLANVGLGPWWALHYGLTRYWPVTIGQASQLTGLVMVGLSWLLGVRPGIATAMNVVVVGVVADLVLQWRLIPEGTGGLDSYVLLLLGVFVSGLGTAIYVKGNLGAGPRDSFMLGLAAHLGGRVGPARNAMDGSITLLGWLLGAPIGPGTLIFALGTGPAVAFWFKRLQVEVKSRAAVRSAPAR